MLRQVVGLIKMEELEKRVNHIKFTCLKATLRSLTTYRNTEAHTHLRGVTRRLHAPSVTKRYFSVVYEGLQDFDYHLGRVSF